MPQKRSRTPSGAASRARSQGPDGAPSLVVTLRVQSGAGRAALRGEGPVLDSIRVAIPRPDDDQHPRQASPDADAPPQAVPKVSRQPTPQPSLQPSAPEPSVNMTAQESLNKELRALYLARVEETMAEVEAELELADQQRQKALDAAERDQNVHNIHQALLGDALHMVHVMGIPTLVVHPADSEAEARVKTSVADSMASMHFWDRNVRQNRTEADGAVQKIAYLSDELEGLRRRREAAMRML
ncbi:hypothetical protein ACJ41O_012597 [Fusarium nematophilum]